MSTFKKILKILGIMILVFILLIIIAIAAYCNYPKLKASKTINDFHSFTVSLEDMHINTDASVIALGEATHGSAELQQLKLTLLKKLVEENAVRSIALEADSGECDVINEMINSSAFDAHEAVMSMAFTLYHTSQMEELFTFIHDYNLGDGINDPIRFYGYDMQNPGKTVEAVRCIFERYSVDTSILDRFIKDAKDNTYVSFDKSLAKEYQDEFRSLAKKIAEASKNDEDTDISSHTLRVLDQYFELCKCDYAYSNNVRDKLMAENVLWISAYEKNLGHGSIMISGHNGHICASNTYDSMGVILRKQLGDDYYAVGTDFKTATVNLPEQYSGRRVNRSFASASPLASQVSKEESPLYLDFACVGQGSELYSVINSYVHMGSLGETYAVYMYLFPYTYRIVDVPAKMYNSMILYRNLTPIAPYSDK